MSLEADIDEFVLTEQRDNGGVTLVIDLARKSSSAVQRWVREQCAFWPAGTVATEFVSRSELIERKKQSLDPEKGLRQQTESLVSASDTQKKLIEYMALAQSLQASDIHIRVNRVSKITTLEIRLHGDLEIIDELTSEEGDTLVSTGFVSMCDVRVPSLYNDNAHCAGRIAQNFARAGGLFGARYQHMPTVNGLYVVLRTIPDDSRQQPDLPTLGWLPEQIIIARRLLRRPEGLIILTGPTGSGKSTTLRVFSSMWLELTRYRRRLLTVENPPEGLINFGVQTPVIGNDWDSSNAAVLRSDPDAILYGEMQDLASLMSAIYSGHTGHLVFDTLHAQSAVGGLTRMEIMGADRRLIADASLVIGLVSQRLVQTLCPHCSIPWSEMVGILPEEQRDYLEKYCTEEGVCSPVNLRFHNPDGCEHCQQKLSTGRTISAGLTGRTSIVEIVDTDARFMDRWLSHGTGAARQYWISKGGITRRMHLLRLLNQGLVDPLTGDAVCPLDEDERLSLEVE